MKTIPLTRGLVALVDDEDYEALAQFKWDANRSATGRAWYARRNAPRCDGHRHKILMHREILSAPSGAFVDHIDGDGLNNQRANLRLATLAENNCNRRINCNNTSGFKGVHWCRTRAKWIAQIAINGRRLKLGRYDTPEEAHAAYAAASQKYHGAFGRVA